MNINIILPYKETYSNELAGAVSLLIAEVKKRSKFKKKIRIFGSLNLEKPLTKDYINCDLSKKPFYYIFGRTSYYLENIKKKISKKNLQNTKNVLVHLVVPPHFCNMKKNRFSIF